MRNLTVAERKERRSLLEALVVHAWLLVQVLTAIVATTFVCTTMT